MHPQFQYKDSFRLKSWERWNRLNFLYWQQLIQPHKRVRWTCCQTVCGLEEVNFKSFFLQWGGGMSNTIWILDKKRQVCGRWSTKAGGRAVWDCVCLSTWDTKVFRYKGLCNILQRVFTLRFNLARSRCKRWTSQFRTKILNIQRLW